MMATTDADASETPVAASTLATNANFLSADASETPDDEEKEAIPRYEVIGEVMP